jgi:hypothetical protein
LGDLVRRIRLETACGNLERIANLKQEVERRNDWLTELQGQPLPSCYKAVSNVLTELSQIGTRIEQIKRDAEDLDVDSAFVDGVKQVVAQVKSSEEKLDDARQTLLGMRRGAADVRNRLVKPLVDESDLGLLAERARIAKREANDKDWTADDPEWQPWLDHCEHLFDEYVAILFGIAVRDAGFGDPHRINDLFRIADRLPELWGRVGTEWRSLAVPARIEHDGTSEVRVVRIGFPEWTVWALPLAQRDFAYVFLDRAGRERPSAQVRALLPDAAATVVTGLAYAAAALLLRIDPAKVKRSTLEARRSATIIRALSVLAEERGDDGLSLQVEFLRGEWLDAVHAAGGDRGAVDALVAATDVEQAVDTARRMLRDNGGLLSERNLPIWAERWADITQTAARLGVNAAPGADVGEATTAVGEAAPVRLMLILNAAWLARTPAGNGAAPDAAAGEGIADAALDLLKKIADPPTAESPIRNLGPA